MVASVAALVGEQTTGLITFTWYSLDVLKALCLGAKAVGLGRAFLYAQSVSMPFAWDAFG